MTPAQLEQQSRDAVIAYLRDSSVKLELTCKDGSIGWARWNACDNFYLSDRYYRIAQPKPWYRVALFKDGVALVTESDLSDKDVGDMKNFIKWLTNRIEYDN